MTRVSSIFSQTLQLISRLEFESAVRKQGAERHARGFSCWGQFIAMLFCQLGNAKSLREICGGLAASEGKLRHLGLPQAPARATLAYANQHRPWQLYRTVFDQLLAKCQSLAASQPGTRKKKKFRFKNPLMSLDASVIDLCATMFDWAKFRLTKGAVKLHLLLDHDGYLPSFAVITEGKKHEVRVARQMRFTPGTILVFDRGYTDYEWFVSLIKQGVYFVTRLKENADYGVVEELTVPQRRGVLRDQVIFFYKLAQAGTDAYFRRIEFYDEERDRVLVFLTSHRELAAATIAHLLITSIRRRRVVFSCPETVAASKNPCGNFGPSAEDATLDGADRHAAGEILAVEVNLWLVAFQSGGAAAPTTVCLPRSVGVDR